MRKDGRRVQREADTPEWKVRNESGQLVVELTGHWTTDCLSIPSFTPEIFQNIPGNRSLSFDCTKLNDWDTSFISFLWTVLREADNAQIKVDTQGVPPSAQRLIALLPSQFHEAPSHRRKPPQVLHALGSGVTKALEVIGTTVLLGWDTLRSGFAPKRGQGRMRIRDLLSDIFDAGPSALLIVSIVNFLLGCILAFVGAVQLRKFAADAYVANLVGLACVRELSAVLTAIIMAGRTGGAYAARISTMLSNEEIDALRVFGIPVTSYIVLPSIASLMLMMPLLYLYGCLMSMIGGFVVTTGMLPSVTGIGYWHQTFGAVNLQQFEFGFTKSIFFAIMIGLISCQIGLNAGRSAADVGKAATSAVVVGIVGIIAMDAFFAVIAMVIDI
jgi:phospholipid/cholesterol/gamma-HCH transport system permease protein